MAKAEWDAAIKAARTHIGVAENLLRQTGTFTVQDRLGCAMAHLELAVAITAQDLAESDMTWNQENIRLIHADIDARRASRLER